MNTQKRYNDYIQAVKELQDMKEKDFHLTDYEARHGKRSKHFTTLPKRSVNNG